MNYDVKVNFRLSEKEIEQLELISFNFENKKSETMKIFVLQVIKDKLNVSIQKIKQSNAKIIETLRLSQRIVDLLKEISIKNKISLAKLLRFIIQAGIKKYKENKRIVNHNIAYIKEEMNYIQSNLITEMQLRQRYL